MAQWLRSLAVEQFPAPKWLLTTITPVPGNPVPSSGRHGTQTGAHTHINKDEHLKKIKN